MPLLFPILLVDFTHLRKLLISRNLLLLFLFNREFEFAMARKFAIDLLERLTGQLAYLRTRLIADDLDQQIIGARIANFPESENRGSAAWDAVRLLEGIEYRQRSARIADAAQPRHHVEPLDRPWSP